MAQPTNTNIPQDTVETESTLLLARETIPYTPSPRPMSGRSQSTPDLFDSLNSIGRRARSSTVSSVVSTSIEIVQGHLDKRKFMFLLAISLFIYLAFLAAFAPRTSLARDFRRWHNSKLTTSEVYRIFLDTLQEDNFIHHHMKSYTEIDNGAESLNYTMGEMKILGFEPKIETYYPWVTSPEATDVQLIKDGKYVFNASLIEDFPSKQIESAKFKKGYHAYSPNGEVKSSYIYCNYGTLNDYKTLLDHNIPIEGKIHILRDGLISTGMKLKNAELYGASSALIYNDPYDDGLVTKKNGFKTFPEGPARNPSSIKRDSVEYMFDFPGDPTSPNFPSKSKDIERLSPAGKIPRIPSIPISAKEIRPILLELNGKGIKLGNGDIEGFDYFCGPSDDKVQINLLNKQTHFISEINDIILEIPGIFSSGDIIIASHRDSWVYPGGAANPSSGSAILLEIARGLSKLRSKGWIPLRTIKLVSWDGESAAKIGSTEFIEDYASDLKNNALAYIDLDNAISGTEFHCAANKLMENAIIIAAKSTSFKGNEEWTLYEEWKNETGSKYKQLCDDPPSSIFQSHLGISSASFKFRNNMKTDAINHANSFFDSHEWMEHFVDPDFRLHGTLASFSGLLTLMLGEKELHFFSIHPYMKQVHKRTVELNRLINDIFPHDNELHHLSQTVEARLGLLAWQDSVIFDKKVEKLYQESFTDMPIWFGFKKLKLFISLQRMNKKLRSFDKLFVTHLGLDDREWMKHSLLAPNKYDGLTGDILPGVHEALVDMDRSRVSKELNILLEQFENVRKLLA
ncbi:similar to Saccharomyces cerevisiae YJR126C VPS70 Protein of unknown function involved in vacuolar protein sorting [Maudiozyma barnettii]|uniref:Vacuolar protein sorting-associated protein 70 n=1 Tax=Maudiozyma barnettii TaxID=61262 RepID=A0A8H2ZLW9_9SACH|nr:putative zinc metalloprotease [Kazachstania barnettii]CAB4256507.1 similar to Saccharomyces cerevisiae YJR126C VPS70 Protein of unknown function involved in vacuolar protein sorting [Kazachstania barnettii]CAD1785110.1 similar to Saccharomyces cerevisiae YJR126C VPS70 Protein of unknown function involved in vacuolar protein sorting [Kazachstania barnettii]